MEEKTYLVLFYGNFIPLQGVSYMVRAAKILEQHPDIRFLFIGDGQTKAEVVRLAKELGVGNVIFMGKLTQQEIVRHIRRADICLGIFGDTAKAQRVIPNKVYEAIAMGKPVISADMPAIRELFTDRENILLCRTADADDLAARILELKNDANLRTKIAEGGYAVFQQNATPTMIGRKLLAELE